MRTATKVSPRGLEAIEALEDKEREAAQRELERVVAAYARGLDMPPERAADAMRGAGVSVQEVSVAVEMRQRKDAAVAAWRRYATEAMGLGDETPTEWPAFVAAWLARAEKVRAQYGFVRQWPDLDVMLAAAPASLRKRYTDATTAHAQAGERLRAAKLHEVGRLRAGLEGLERLIRLLTQRMEEKGGQLVTTAAGRVRWLWKKGPRPIHFGSEFWKCAPDVIDAEEAERRMFELVRDRAETQAQLADAESVPALEQAVADRYRERVAAIVEVIAC